MLLSVCLASCLLTSIYGSPKITQRLTTASDDADNWDYSNTKYGPANWGSLSPAYAACSTGKLQSPINIKTNSLGFVKDETSPLKFSWKSISNVSLTDGHHSVVANITATGASNTVEFKGVTYTMANFHFHRSSEHRINNQEFPLELHLVHASLSGYVVPTFLFKVGETSNGFIKTLIKADQASKEVDQTTVEKVDFEPLLKAVKSMEKAFSYVGSLTVPPCTEGINFVISREYVTISKEDLEYLYAALPVSNRPIQRQSDGTTSPNVSSAFDVKPTLFLWIMSIVGLFFL